MNVAPTIQRVGSIRSVHIGWHPRPGDVIEWGGKVDLVVGVSVGGVVWLKRIVAAAVAAVGEA